ncbi:MULTISPECIES: glycosyltransferase [unclassified Variovorax]|uniref:glycosyltransferase n=1 Tax=unclassified Variovorax TaxID=663243 RepID=UPI002579066F|nr:MULTISPECIES: glycosyltransferase [unclassified Variovorax]MDM0090033.1 glycosyltransferase [Variovorax sp. J22G40]MDM0148301.1 glycosyltransferase [Variovorax sp. J2P1-31]
MHTSALDFGKLFFETYCSELQGATVHDIGAQNVNGSLSDVLPPHLAYVGVDFVEGRGVDIVLEDPYRLPFADDSLDVIVCSSCFEHSQFFWLAFLEMLRVLKPEGLLYLNVPSNGSFHRYPVDCWRFYPDAGMALEAWANREGFASKLLESFVGERSPEGFASGGAWNDFVAVFVKDAVHAPHYARRMLHSLPNCWNGVDATAGKEVNSAFLSPDHAEVTQLQIAMHRQQEKAGAQALRRDAQVRQLEEALAAKDQALAQIAVERESADAKATLYAEQAEQLQRRLTETLDSRSWRATAGVRKLGTLARKVRNRGRRMLAGSNQGAAHLDAAEAKRAALEAEVATLAATGLFDESYYLATYPDVAHGNQPLHHYCAFGWRAGLDPSAEFSTRYYLESYPDIEEAGMNPLLHYALAGQEEARHTLPKHLRKRPAEKVAAECEAIRRTELFDEAFYLAMYPDIRPVPQDPLHHYCERGWLEGRDPSDMFNTEAYLSTYQDIDESGLNPLWHYAVAGAGENRSPDPGELTRCEDDVNFGPCDSDVKFIVMHHCVDWAAVFAGASYRNGTRPGVELGFYESANPALLRKQAEMAARHGVHGFCFVVDARNQRSHPMLDVWQAQTDIDLHCCARLDLHPDEPCSESLLVSIARASGDPRWIRVGGLPMLLVQPAAGRDVGGALRAIRRTLERLRGKFFLVACLPDSVDPLQDCDAVTVLPTGADGTGPMPSYALMAKHELARLERAATAALPRLPLVLLGARGEEPEVRRHEYRRFRLGTYRRWLDAAIAHVRASTMPSAERFVFADAWNDWQAGLVLEPDLQGGFGRLNESTRALMGIDSGLATPKVTVIVVSYNHERFLRRRLDSIYAQSYKNFEVLLLDDRSTDQSRALLDTYAAKHPANTRTIYNETNSGSPFRQWAKGIAAATGDLVWIAESDDFCNSTFLEEMVRSFDDKAVMLASARCVFVGSDEAPLPDGFKSYVADLECASKWNGPYVETAHNEVRAALGIKNTIPNASGVLFRRPLDMPLLEDPDWRAMRVAGDWVFYLHLLRGGKIAYVPGAINYFRRYEGSAAEVTYRKRVFYQELGFASRTVAALYDVPLSILERCRDGYRRVYRDLVGGDDAEFDEWYDYDAVLRAREARQPNVLVTTMGFFPGGAEIFPIQLANEFKAQGQSVLLLSTGLGAFEDRIWRMHRNDVPVVETHDLEATRQLIRDFGIEVLNSHQWYIQRYPALQENVFEGLRAHVATLHGMIEHGSAFDVTSAELGKADTGVSRWVYTADKNLTPFIKLGLHEPGSPRFLKMPNGVQAPHADAVSRAQLHIPDDAFVLCCVSRAIPDKGWRETMAAVGSARELSGRDIHLVLVGNGPVYNELRREAIPSFVHLVGFSENSVGHYLLADMGIMLTRFKSESFPLTIIDCLFAGRPYIATDVGEIPNMLTDGEQLAGALVRLEDWKIPVQEAARVIAAFADDAGRYQAATGVVSRLISRYRIESVAQRYIEVFDECCRRGDS